MRRQKRWGIASAAVAAVAASVWLAAGSDAEPASFAEPRPGEPPGPPARGTPKSSATRRCSAPGSGGEPTSRQFDFGSNPPDPSETLSGDVVSCRFLSEALGGTTPKFNCVLRDGEVVKVKYGRNR